MTRIGPGSEVMAPHPMAGGGYILKLACVLTVMPELVIVEYYEDKMRYCLPRGAVRLAAAPLIPAL